MQASSRSRVLPWLLVGSALVLVAGALVWLLWPGRQVLLVGDSILRQTGPSLDDEVGWPDDVRNEAVNGSGLLTPAVFDWEATLPGLLEDDPDTVVVLFIGNYTDTDLPTTEDGTPIELGSPEFFEAWGAASEGLATTLLDADVEVVWVLPPPVVTPELQDVIEGIRAEYEAMLARHPEIVVVDAYDVLATPDGQVLGEVEGPDGEPVSLRFEDGVHLSEEGADRLGALIAQQL